jgi:glycosyltransferase involved in cell wall biosynthesis/SAM-dependent methyltransferase
VIWASINFLKQEGYEYFNLGLLEYVNCPDPDLQRVAFFKRKWNIKEREEEDQAGLGKFLYYKYFKRFRLLKSILYYLKSNPNHVDMYSWWDTMGRSYGTGQDLEEKVRILASGFVAESGISFKDPGVLELGCGNGKILKKISQMSKEIKTLVGVDGSKKMLEVAEAEIGDSRLKLIRADLLEFLKNTPSQKYEFVLSCNTLHNLKNRKQTIEALNLAAKLVKPNGYIVFDIRNSFNPFISLGYRKSRRQGYAFYPNSYFRAQDTLVDAGFEIVDTRPIFYEDLVSAGKKDKNFFFKFLYAIYLRFTSLKLFAPYVLVIARKKQEKFVSIIWGYHQQLYSLSRVENYHLEALKAAESLGFATEVLLINSKARIQDDPNFHGLHTKVLNYQNAFRYLRYLWQNRNSVIYANTFIWQSLIVGLFAKKSVFMGHDSVLRKTALKQKIQNFLFKRFSRIRVVSGEEKEFLIAQGIKPEKVFVLPLAVDTDKFKASENSSREGLVFLGNVTTDKNISTILEALAEVKKVRPNIVLDIIGEVRLPEFKVKVQSLGLEDNVRERGFIKHSDLPNFLNLYKIYVNASVSEGQCLAAFESALSGLGLCLPRTMSFEGVFREGALFAHIYDHAKLAENILMFLDDQNLLDRHVKHNQVNIRNRYNSEEVFRQTKQLFSFHEHATIVAFAPEIHEPFIEGVQKTAWSMAQEFVASGETVEIITQHSYGQPIAPNENIKLATQLTQIEQRLLKYVAWLVQATLFIGM